VVGPVRADGLRLALFTDTYTPQMNGVARTLERLARTIAARGGAVRVVTVADPDARDARDARGVHDADGAAVGVERWPSVPFWAYPQLRVAPLMVNRAAAVIDEWRPTLVHAATEFGVGLAGMFAARAAGVPLVSSYHTHFRAYLEFYRLGALGPVFWPLFRGIHNMGARTFAPSAVVARELAALRFHNLRVWTRGVDPSLFDSSFRSAAMRARLGARHERDVVVLYVGRLAREKGIDVLARAWRLAAASPGVRFAVVGDGPAEAEFRAAAPEGTCFMGRLTGRALSEAYASADLFAFPSVTETFGNVVLEAMASGLAVVAPDVGATTEYATAETAQLFRGGDATSLAEAIGLLVHDAPLRAGLVSRSRALAARMTWEAVFDQLLTDYREVVATARP